MSKTESITDLSTHAKQASKVDSDANIAEIGKYEDLIGEYISGNCYSGITVKLRRENRLCAYYNNMHTIPYADICEDCPHAGEPYTANVLLPLYISTAMVGREYYSTAGNWSGSALADNEYNRYVNKLFAGNDGVAYLLNRMPIMWSHSGKPSAGGCLNGIYLKIDEDVEKPYIDDEHEKKIDMLLRQYYVFLQMSETTLNTDGIVDESGNARRNPPYLITYELMAMQCTFSLYKPALEGNRQREISDIAIDYLLKNKLARFEEGEKSSEFVLSAILLTYVSIQCEFSIFELFNGFKRYINVIAKTVSIAGIQEEMEVVNGLERHFSGGYDWKRTLKTRMTTLEKLICSFEDKTDKGHIIDEINGNLKRIQEEVKKLIKAGVGRKKVKKGVVV